MRGFGVVKTNSLPGWMDKEIPEIGYLEMLCEPVVLCPCTSDVHSALDLNLPPGLILGHEVVGRVVSCGAGVKDFKKGDIVLVPATTPNWRAFEIQDGFHQHIGGLFGGMKMSISMDGSFAEYFRVIDPDMNCAIVPKGISLETAVLTGDMVSSGFHGAELADIRFGDTVVVFGAGPVGLMAVVGAKLRGAGKIIVVESRSKPIEAALEYGASCIVNYQEEDVEQAILSYTKKRPVDSAIICGGSSTVIETAYNVVKPSGTIANVNFQPGPMVIPTGSSGGGCSHQRFVGGFCPGGRVRMERLFAMIQERRFNPELLITHKLKGFDEIETSWHMMHQKTDDLIKPIVYID